MTQRRGAARLAAAGVASGLLAIGAIAGAGAAAADGGPSSAGGAKATLGGLKVKDVAILTEKGERHEIPAGLFEMAVDNGGKIQTYCIDFHNPTQTSAQYQEVPWSASSLHDNPDAGKINWILQHSYPQVDEVALSKSLHLDTTLTPELAAAGTQVAIWRYSDHVDVTAKNADAEKLADYLQKNAEDTGEPMASLSLDPAAVSGKSGQKLGPVTVRTNAATVQVALDKDAPVDITLVDKNGRPVTTAKNGDQLFFNVPAGTADGAASLTAHATTKVPIGRAFASETRSQTQILAGSSDSTVTATATVTWAKQGPIPAVSATVDCARSGVDVTATNKGDQAFTFELAGRKYTVAAGKSQTITVPVKEDQPYEITISGPNGFTKTFKGVLDCKTTGTDHPTPTTQPSPASVGGSTGGDLAETGSSNATPVIAGVAIALVVIGGGAVFFFRKKKSPTAGE